MIISTSQMRPSWGVGEHLPTRPAFPPGRVQWRKPFEALTLKELVHGATGETKDPRR